MQNHTTRQKNNAKPNYDAKRKQSKTTPGGKKNNAKPHYKAKKMQNHTTGQKKGMENHTEMQSHATMKTKDKKNHHNITSYQSKKTLPIMPCPMFTFT